MFYKNSQYEIVAEEYKINLSESDSLIFSETPDGNLIQEFIHNSDQPKSKAEKIADNRTEISAFIFEYLSRYNIPTYFIERISANQLRVLKTTSVPVSVKIYNHATSSFQERFKIQKGTQLLFPVLENYYIDKDSSKTIINETHVAGMNIITVEDLRSINKLALKVNAILKPFFERRNLILPEIDLEFGKYKDRFLVCGELSPVTFKVWNTSSLYKIDYDYFNFIGSKIFEQYVEFKKRLLFST